MWKKICCAVLVIGLAIYASYHWPYDELVQVDRFAQEIGEYGNGVLYEGDVRYRYDLQNAQELVPLFRFSEWERVDAEAVHRPVVQFMIYDGIGAKLYDNDQACLFNEYASMFVHSKAMYDLPEGTAQAVAAYVKEHADLYRQN